MGINYESVCIQGRRNYNQDKVISIAIEAEEIYFTNSGDHSPNQVFD
jgi:hypothetical protein